MNFVWQTKATVEAKRLALPQLVESVRTYLKEKNDAYILTHIELYGGRVFIKLIDTLTNRKIQYLIQKDRFETTPLEYCVIMSEPMNQYSQSYIYKSLATHSPWSNGLAEILFQWLLDVKINLLAKYNSQRIMPKIKKDIIAAAWHPRRVSAWLEAGAPLEDL